MDKHIIGENAGVIWRLLNNGERWEYESLKAASGLSDRDLNLAIGWLARENKIFFEPASGLSDRDLNLAIGWLARENKIFFERSKDEDKEYMYLSIDIYL